MTGLPRCVGVCLQVVVVLAWTAGAQAQSRDASATTTRRSVAVGDTSRDYLLFVPPGYSKTMPAPLVLNLHGGGGSAEAQSALSRFDAVAAEHSVLVAYPEGTRTWVGVGRMWNAGTCCGAAARRHVDDVAYLLRVIEHVAKDYAVDRRRVYATGMSNGAMMAYRLACEAADRIAAVASVAGPMVVERCVPSRALSVLHVHGSADGVVPFDGGVSRGTKLPPVRRTIDFWIARGRCPAAPSIEKHGDATCEWRQPCSDGTAVGLCTVTGGGHTWAGGRTRVLGGVTSRSFAASEQIWQFFARHPLPARQGR